MGTYGDSVLDRSGLKLIQGGTDFVFQCRMLRVGDQQATSLQHPDDALAQCVEQPGQFGICRLPGSPIGWVTPAANLSPVEEQHVQMDVRVQRRSETLIQCHSPGPGTGADSEPRLLDHES